MIDHCLATTLVSHGVVDVYNCQWNYATELGVEGWYQLWWMRRGGREAVEDSVVLWWRRTHAELVQYTDQSFQAAVHGHDLTDAG